MNDATGQKRCERTTPHLCDKHTERHVDFASMETPRHALTAEDTAHAVRFFRSLSMEDQERVVGQTEIGGGTVLHISGVGLCLLVRPANGLLGFAALSTEEAADFLDEHGETS